LILLASFAAVSATSAACNPNKAKFQDRNAWKISSTGQWLNTLNYYVTPGAGQADQYGFLGSQPFWQNTYYDEDECSFFEQQFWPQSETSWAIGFIQLEIDTGDKGDQQSYIIDWLTGPTPASPDFRNSGSLSIALNDLSGASSFWDPVTEQVQYQQVYTFTIPHVYGGYTIVSYAQGTVEIDGQEVSVYYPQVIAPVISQGGNFTDPTSVIYNPFAQSLQNGLSAGTINCDASSGSGACLAYCNPATGVCNCDATQGATCCATPFKKGVCDA